MRPRVSRGMKTFLGRGVGMHFTDERERAIKMCIPSDRAHSKHGGGSKGHP